MPRYIYCNDWNGYVCNMSFILRTDYMSIDTICVLLMYIIMHSY